MIAPPPPVLAKRPLAFFDTECYPNYWLLKFRPRGGVIYTFELFAGESFDETTRGRIRLLFEAYCVVSFNGIRYDVPMIACALAGYTPAQLKWLNDQMIVEKRRPWDMGLPEWRPADHIDVMEVIPGKGGQKYKAGIIHYKTMRDLPYDPSTELTKAQMVEVAEYCENDLGQLEAEFDAVHSQIKLREKVGAKYGLDLRSKSDAQMAEAVLKKRCENATGRRIYAPEIDWNYKFRFDVPEFIHYERADLRQVLELVRNAVFSLGPSGNVAMPPELESLTITIGRSTYKLGLGGLHSQEEKLIAITDDRKVIRMPDVASYYPSLMINSGRWPDALGEPFRVEFISLMDERLTAKKLQKQLEKAGLEGSPEWEEAEAGNSGGKIMINGTFGKTLGAYGVLRAPKMGIQTTISGQLSLLMLIEWMEFFGIPVISANTDGIVIECPREKYDLSNTIISQWEKRTSLTMETVDYQAIYARDVNNYFAIVNENDVKRKGEYAPTSLIFKKAPDVEICSDAVEAFLTKGLPVAYTIAACRDIRKFVTIQNVSGHGVKMWGEGPRKDTKVRDMTDTLIASGWVKDGRKWRRGETLADARTAYAACFAPQRPEYLGKVIRWYYSTQAPGPIVYASNGNTVGLSYGARPCMTLPDEFPDDVDYAWYIAKAERMLKDLGLT